MLQGLSRWAHSACQPTQRRTGTRSTIWSVRSAGRQLSRPSWPGRATSAALRSLRSSPPSATPCRSTGPASTVSCSRSAYSCPTVAAPVTYSSCGAPTGELVLGQQPDTDDAAVPARLQPHAGTCTEVLCNASRNAARVAPRRLLTADDGACCSSGPLQISLQCGLWWSSRA